MDLTGAVSAPETKHDDEETEDDEDSAWEGGIAKDADSEDVMEYEPAPQPKKPRDKTEVADPPKPTATPKGPPSAARVSSSKSTKKAPPKKTRGETKVPEDANDGGSEADDRAAPKDTPERPRSTAGGDSSRSTKKAPPKRPKTTGTTLSLPVMYGACTFNGHRPVVTQTPTNTLASCDGYRYDPYKRTHVRLSLFFSQ